MKYVGMIHLGIAIVLACTLQAGADPADSPKDTGYRGIWYYNQKTNDEYVYKYSGGLGTYCAKHIPMAIYAPAVNKTFFVYGGTKPGENALLEMISYYDHATGEVPRPVILLDKKTEDAHDNPVLAIDDAGYLWVFASAHGTARPAYIFKSTQPYSIDDFELVLETNYSYPQPWYISGKGFLFIHTAYDGGRALSWQTSPDGKTWSERKRFAFFGEGHYQVSWPRGTSVGTAFNYHPKAFQGDAKRHGLNWRTNVYYAETHDMGATWQTITGEPLQIPLSDPHNPALIREYESEGLLAYVKDLNYDAQGRPVLLHVTAPSWEPGPDHGPREWRVAHWKGDAWAWHSVTTSDNNYDTGSIHVEQDGTWRIIGPAETGPQAFNPGGEVAMWVSKDEGATWTRERMITHDSPFNHTYCRRPLNAHPDFYAFWADGHGRQPSESRLYFCDQTGAHVRRLPYVMEGDTAKPEELP